MPDARWKAFEREVAAALGGTRAGPTGNTTSDVRHPTLSPECKYMKRLSLRKADIAQAEANAEPGKPWILALKEHRQRGGYVVMPLETFAAILNRSST